MLAKGEEPAVIEEMIIESVDGKRNEESTEGRNEELVEEVEYNGKPERSKGGGGGGGGEERRITTCHQFMRASEEGSVSNLKGSPMHSIGTQISATLISPLASSKTKPRTYLHLKSNKVDPIRDADASDENPGMSETVTSRFVSPAVRKDERAESPNPIEHRKKDVCSYCKSLKPTSANYCNIFKDKRGRYFCEFCAPTDKITSRLEVTDLKKLRCANCRLSLRARGVKTNIKLKSDACPKCGQSQRQTAASSPSSM
ncbi:unnamed protein product [Lasius platythorax]|uniref:Uncharacterized protein n=1 Tax=Lasius platythorax TaxID=488582 RepID=A0AAV2NHT4_9HYME